MPMRNLFAVAELFTVEELTTDPLPPRMFNKGTCGDLIREGSCRSHIMFSAGEGQSWEFPPLMVACSVSYVAHVHYVFSVSLTDVG